MNNRSWLIPAAAVVLISSAIIPGHTPQPHVEPSMDVSYMFPPECPAASGSVAESYVRWLSDYVIK